MLNTRKLDAFLLANSANLRHLLTRFLLFPTLKLLWICGKYSGLTSYYKAVPKTRQTRLSWFDLPDLSYHQHQSSSNWPVPCISYYSQLHPKLKHTFLAHQHPFNPFLHHFCPLFMPNITIFFSAPSTGISAAVATAGASDQQKASCKAADGKGASRDQIGKSITMDIRCMDRMGVCYRDITYVFLQEYNFDIANSLIQGLSR